MLSGVFLEPYYIGSHRVFADWLTGTELARWSLLTLPGRHFRWRMRGAAAWFAQECRTQLEAPNVQFIVATSALSLTDLHGLRSPHAPRAPKTVLYFHENQLAYPVQDQATGERDLHFGFTQILSALAASACVFNSEYNRRSFLTATRTLLKRMPDHAPLSWVDEIEAKTHVLPVPVQPLIAAGETIAEQGDPEERERGPILLWNHRWEYDKAPEVFFRALDQLASANVPFRVAICGQTFATRPKVFDTAPDRLGERVVHLGQADRDRYHELLRRSHIAISTAIHEFQGVALQEAIGAGTWPLAPDRLAYPETLTRDHLYSDEAALVERLANLCRRWSNGEIQLRSDRRHLLSHVDPTRVRDGWRELIGTLVGG